MGYDQLRKGRASLAHQLYLVTAVTDGRRPWFRDLYLGRLVIHEMRTLDESGMVKSFAFVLMPDHLHWMFQLGSDLSLQEVMRRVKGASSRAINLVVGRTGAVWQRGFHDHALRREEDIRDVARYIVANPLRAKLVDSLGNYPLWDAKWSWEEIMAG